MAQSGAWGVPGNSGVIPEARLRGRGKGKGCDIGYALAASSCEGAKQRGDMHRHSP